MEAYQFPAKIKDVLLSFPLSNISTLSRTGSQIGVHDQSQELKVQKDLVKSGVTALDLVTNSDEGCQISNSSSTELEHEHVQIDLHHNDSEMEKDSVISSKGVNTKEVTITAAEKHDDHSHNGTSIESDSNKRKSDWVCMNHFLLKYILEESGCNQPSIDINAHKFKRKKITFL